MFCDIIDCIFDTNMFDFLKNNIGIIIATFACFGTIYSCYLTRKSNEMTKQQFDWVREDRENQEMFWKIKSIDIRFFELCTIFTQERKLTMDIFIDFILNDFKSITDKEKQEYSSNYNFIEKFIPIFKEHIICQIMIQLQNHGSKYENFKEHDFQNEYSKKCKEIVGGRDYTGIEFLKKCAEISQVFYDTYINNLQFLKSYLQQFKNHKQEIDELYNMLTK